jgi:hypothetical protein
MIFLAAFSVLSDTKQFMFHFFPCFLLDAVPPQYLGTTLTKYFVIRVKVIIIVIFFCQFWVTWL